MKRLQPDNELYITTDELRAAGIEENTALKGKARKSPIWVGVKDPECRTKVLWHYESMGDKYKKMLWQIFGDPYQYIVKQPIKKLVVKDFAAESFYIQHKYNGKKLTTEQIKEYTEAASWLNMLNNISNNYIKKDLGISVVDFYKKVGEIMKAEGVKLPSSYRHLRPTMEAYKKEGYSYLLHGNLGNTAGVKVADELSQSILYEMIAHANQYDDIYISWQYNAWAKANDYETIIPETVGNYRRRYYNMLIIQREGNERYNKVYGKSIKAFRPTQPTFLWESDDNHTDYYFVDWEDTTEKKYWKTFKAVFVTDSFNDLVLGYAIGREITIDLVREAYRNAMHYVHHLTGNWHLPHETKTDRWALKALQPFYESISNYAPAPVGSKNRGYIEQFFGSSHFERCMKVGAINYTGHNITAKKSGVNREALVANKKNFPTVQQAPQYFADLVTRLRLMPQGDGKPSKQQQWVDAYNAMPADKKKIIGIEDYLLKFGIEKPETNQITKNGVDLRIGNKLHNYDVPDEYFYKHKGCSLFTYYDPSNLNTVLLTDKKSIRFVADKPRMHGKAMADMVAGDRTDINERLEARKDHVKQVSEGMVQRQNVLQHYGVNIDKLLTEGNLLKEDRTAAIDNYMENEMLLIEPQRRQSAADKM